MLSAIILVTLLIWSLVKYMLHIRHMESYVKHLKTQGPSIPFIGSIDFLRIKSVSEFLDNSFKFVANNETPLKANIGSVFYIFLDKPEDVKTILMSPNCLDKPYLYSFYPLPLGLLTQRSGASWKPLRKLMNPMFNLKVLQSFLPIFNDKTRSFVKDLENEVGNAAFDVMTYANTCTLNTICSTVMGIDIDLKSTKGKEFIHSLEAAFDMILLRTMKPWLHFDSTYKWTSYYKEEQKHLANIRYFTEKVFVEKTKSYLTSKNNDMPKADEKPQLPIIPMLFEGRLTEDVVRQQIEILLIAGYETTASTISFAILMLAMHPGIQEEAFNELRSVYEWQDEDTTYEHTQQTDLLGRVLKETMRLFPIGAHVSRTATTDVSVSNCVIPKGATTMLLIYSLHRRRDIWGEDADEFNPDHFLPDNVKSRHPFAFIPFSSGPRNCIGYQYAMISLKVMLSAILRRYRFSSNLKMSDLKLKHGVLLKLENKHFVKVERRRW